LDFEWKDLITILILVVLEGLLSGDNALVLAVIVMPLPEEQQRKALRYGIIGAFALRIVATLLAVVLIRVDWIKLVGGLYLLYLPAKHFIDKRSHGGGEGGPAVPRRGYFGLSLFWSIVIQADLVDLVFAVDSILAAVAVTHKIWVIIAGGLLGILMMRLLTLQVLRLVRVYPKLIDGAYVVILWIGIKLVWVYLHHKHLVPLELREDVSIGVVVALFAGSFLYARAHKGANPEELAAATDAERLFQPDPPHAGPREEEAA
jgi:YkoY family integral membrane protein